jgi:hypothetical protein
MPHVCNDVGQRASCGNGSAEEYIYIYREREWHAGGPRRELCDVRGTGELGIDLLFGLSF